MMQAEKIFVHCCIAGGGPAGMMLGYLLARAGVKVLVLENHGDFMYVRHATNSWAFQCGRFIDPIGWQRAAEPPKVPQPAC